MANIPPEKKERNQRIYKMNIEDKMSQAKIAKIMNISPGRVSQLIKRIKDKK
jgi:DNA-directed RNA polymerase specialized sigma subunit